jgi:hypothetical protein
VHPFAAQRPKVDIRQSGIRSPRHLRMTNSGINKGNIGELRPLARAFLEAYRAAAVKTDEDFRRVVTGDGGYHHFDGGLVELTDRVVKATDDLVDRAIKLIGPKMCGPGVRWCGLILKIAGTFVQASQMT